jgi:hypothetical protein
LQVSSKEELKLLQWGVRDGYSWSDNGWIVTGASCSDHDCGSGANIEEKEDKYVIYVYCTIDIYLEFVDYQEIAEK